MFAERRNAASNIGAADWALGLSLWGVPLGGRDDINNVLRCRLFALLFWPLFDYDSRFLITNAHFNRPRNSPMPNQTNAAEVRLLANRLRWINDQRVISLAQAQEVCRRLGEIISFLDELAEPVDVAAENSELHPMSPDRVRWEHIHRVYEMCNRNVSETARRLNMHRRTLQRILAKRAPR